MTTPPFLPRLFARYVHFSGKHHKKILLGFLAILLLSLIPIRQLQLQTDMAELLPPNHPSVQALRRISGRQKSATNMILIVESADHAANVRFAKVLRPELEKMVPEIFSETQWAPNSEIPDHAARYYWLYAPLADLTHAEELLDRTIAHRKSPLLIDLEGDPEAELKDLRKRMEKEIPSQPAPSEAAQGNQPAESFFVSHEGNVHSLGVMLWRKREGFGSYGDQRTMDLVQQLVAKLRPESFHPSMKVRYTGHIPMALAEQSAIKDDITIATAICTSLVLLSIYLYFRRLGILMAIGAPTFMGILLSLALASVTVRYLNINTAFLISIILGNGINTPIVLLARYGEERRIGTSVEDALALAAERTVQGTSTAMLAASIAYGCLIITDFRGFSQFGLIGGAGMIFVWLSTFLFVPAVLIFGESLRPGIFTPGNNLWRYPFALLGRISARIPVTLGLIALALLGLSVMPMIRYVRDPIEWDLRNLRSLQTEPEKLWGRMDAMGMGQVGAGYIASTGVLLVDKPEQADAVAEAIRQKDIKKGDQKIIRAVRTINSVLPQDQDAKLEVLSRIRQKIDQNKQLMDEAEWKDISGFRPPDHLRKLTTFDLPRQVQEAFTEVDGQRGRLVGIDADYYSDWDGHDLIRLADGLQVEALGQKWVVASASTLFGGMVEMIYRDGKPVTMAAISGVCLLVCLSFGLRSAIPVLLSLAFGLTWLGGAIGYINMKLNFMNFLALPITVGVGVDYAANLWSRMRTEGHEALREIIADTGSAVALCSATTIIGYSSLLLAHNRALRSFGLVADIGEVTCLFAALLLLPMISFLVLRRKSTS